jgi:hypothetical protein
MTASDSPAADGSQAENGRASYPTSWETVLPAPARTPGRRPCGFDHIRAAREALPRLTCRAVAVDSNAYYARPAPRIAEGVAQLAFLIHPDLIDDPGLPYVELVEGGLAATLVANPDPHPKVAPP